MFDILFGWRKASKCKKLIKRVQCRLKLLKNKRSSIVRQLRDDVAQLLKNGHDQIAFNRVEQLFKDESILTVYDVLDHFCEFIIIHLSYIRRRKDCPNDINEAVSSLIFASARCGDLPELQVIRKLFGERYGQKFATAAVELFPGNLVNCQIKEKLSIKSVPDDVKYRLMDEIAWDSSLQQGPLALEYSSELKRQQVNENNEIQVLDRDVQTNYSRTRATQISNVKEMEGKAAYVDSSSDSKTFLTMPCHSQSDITSTSTSSSIVTQSSSIVAESPMDMEVEKADNYAQLGSPYEFTIFDLGTMESRCAGRINTATFEPKGERMAAAYSSESSSQFLEETIVYLDDVEEFRSPMTKFGNCQDQRLFMFKPSVLHKREKCEKGRNEGYIDQNESWNEKAGSRSSRKSRKTAGKRSRKRSVSRENQSMKDVEFVIYYGESCENFPNHNHRSCHQRKHQKKVPIGEIQQSYHVQKRLKQPCCVELGSNFRSSNCRYDQTRSCCSCRFNCGMVTDCSLEHPCYFCTSDDKDDRESPPWKQKRRITNLVASQTHDLEREKLQDFCHCRLFRYGEEMEWASLPQKPTRNCGNGAMMYDTLTCPDLWPNKQSKKVEGDAEGSDYPGSRASSNGSCSQVTSPWTRKEIKAPYLRSMTMPLEQPQDSHTDNILRSTSFPLQRPNHFNSGSSSSSRHVHPKLPDYDELTAKFTALKKAHLQNKHHPSNQQLSGA